MSNIISINNCNIDVSIFQQKNGFYIRIFRGKTTLFNETHKSCSECGEIKEFKYFYKRELCFLGLNPTCNECSCVYYHKHNEQKNEEKNEKAKNYYQENKNKISIKSKMRYQENKEEIKKRSRSNAKYNIDRLPLGYETRNSEGFLQVKCYKCREWVFVTNLQLGNILQAQKGNYIGQYNIYCSDECRKACSEYQNQSSNKESEAFDLGLSLFEYDLLKNKSKDINTIQIAIDKAKERDDYECQNCGSKHDLHGHHIIPVALCLGTEDEYLIYETSNIKTVCSDCHYNVEHIDKLSLGKLKEHNKISKCLM